MTESVPRNGARSDARQQQGREAEAAADDAATATSWNLLHDETVLPLSSFSLVVQVRFRFV